MAGTEPDQGGEVGNADIHTHILLHVCHYALAVPQSEPSTQEGQRSRIRCNTRSVGDSQKLYRSLDTGPRRIRVAVETGACSGKEF
jgi:hypothetical protein